MERRPLGACRRCAVKNSERCCQCGLPRTPRLYTVTQAAEYLGCCERQLRKEIAEQKITYRRAPGGIRFTENDLIERLQPSGGPAAKKLKKNRAAVAHLHDRNRTEYEKNGIGVAGMPLASGSESTKCVRFKEDYANITGHNMTPSSNFE